MQLFTLETTTSTTTHRQRRRRHAMTLALTIIAGATFAISGEIPAASATPPAKASKPDFAYFVGKTITFVVPSKPGGNFDGWPRIFAPLMASYLHATINIEDVSEGGTIPGQDIAAAASPNGLTLGELSLITDIEDDASHTPGINFSLRKVGIVGGLPAADAIWCVAPSLPQQTLSRLVNTKQPVKMLDIIPSNNDAEEQLVSKAYHIPATFITGYSTAATEVAGFQRGDGTMINTSLTALQALILAHLAKPVLQTVSPSKSSPAYSILKKVPTYASFYAAHKPKTATDNKAMQTAIAIAEGSNNIVFVPAGTPPSRTAALTAALRSALAQTGAIAEEQAAGLPTGDIPPKTVEATINSDVKNISVLEKDLG